MTKQESSKTKQESNSCPEWITEISRTVGCVNNNEVKTGSICRVSEKIREAEAKDKGSFNYRPKCVAIGPIHRGTRSDLQIMEETKWRSIHKLLEDNPNTVKICSQSIRDVESIIRASYGEKIEMASEELARNMLLDACFLLELLFRLHETNGPQTQTDPSDFYNIHDKKKMVRVLTDLTLLENQIPFRLLTILSSNLLGCLKAAERRELIATLFKHSPKEEPPLPTQNLAQLLVADAGPNLSKGVYHFLHLIHLCSPDPYPQQHEQSKAPPQLLRCARKLQAFGITIKASLTNHSTGSNKTGILASALAEFVDKFEFKIELNETQRELIIPTLHIKEATEVKWRNLIAWEQLGLIGIGYKFSSYAYFFKCLVSSVHDIQMLKEKGVIMPKEAKDEDLVKMFQSIISGEEQMDGRYREVCEKLNKMNVNGVMGCCVLILRMVWHYFQRFLEWLQRGLISSLLSFVDIYLGTPWKFVGVVVGAALLALTITQTVYAIRAA